MDDPTDRPFQTDVEIYLYFNLPNEYLAFTLKDNTDELDTPITPVKAIHKAVVDCFGP